MARWRGWQRGAINMVEVGISVIVVGIVTAGTTASIVWSRDALTHQEHYKAAVYILRGKLETWQAGVQLIPEARDWSRASSLLHPTSYPPVALDQVSDRGGRKPVLVYCSVDSVIAVDYRDTGEGVDFYRVTMSARWTERPYAGARGSSEAVERQVVFKTSVAGRAVLG